MLSTITIKGKDSSNTRKLYYLQDNVGEIIQKEKIGFKSFNSHELTYIIQSALEK